MPTDGGMYSVGLKPRGRTMRDRSGTRAKPEHGKVQAQRKTERQNKKRARARGR